MDNIKLLRNWSFQIASGITLLLFMQVAMISPAFSRMIDALQISKQSIGLIITVNALPNLILAPFIGVIADKYGRKKILVPSLFLYGIAGGCCAFTSDFNTILIFRLLQGIGSASLFGIALSIIGDTFSEHNRAAAMGLNTTINYSGYIIYPLLGGALAGLDWHYSFLPFFLAVPLGIIAIFKLQYKEERNIQTLKQYFGNTLRYLKNSKVIWLFLAIVITYVLLFGAYLIYFNLLLSTKFQASPFIVGISVAAIGLVTAAVAYFLGILSKRYSLVSIMVAAFVIYAVSMVIIPFIPNIWLLLLPVILFGIAHGLNIPSLNIMGAGVAPTEHRGGFMAIFNSVLMLGMTIAPLIMGLAFTFTGLTGTFLIAGALSLIVPLALLLIRKGKQC